MVIQQVWLCFGTDGATYCSRLDEMHELTDHLDTFTDHKCIQTWVNNG